MTKFQKWYAIVLLICLSSIALYAPTAAADPRDGAYLLTIKDATTGAFASRGVITLHGDRTLSAIDSAQGGPAFFFSSQEGAWKPDGKQGAVGRTLDFNFPGQGVARLDYVFNFGSDDSDITGTVTLTTFPLQADPLHDEGGTVVGTFMFDGARVRP